MLVPPQTFFEGVEGLIATGTKVDEVGYRLDYSRNELKKCVREYPGKEVGHSHCAYRSVPTAWALAFLNVRAALSPGFPSSGWQLLAPRRRKPLECAWGDDCSCRGPLK